MRAKYSRPVEATSKDFATDFPYRILIVGDPSDELVNAGLQLLGQFCFERAGTNKDDEMDTSDIDAVVFCGPAQLHPSAFGGIPALLLLKKAQAISATMLMASGFDDVLIGYFSAADLRTLLLSQIAKAKARRLAAAGADEAFIQSVTERPMLENRFATFPKVAVGYATDSTLSRERY